MTFARRQNCIHFDYEINGTVLERCEKYKDLGVTFDTQLTFNCHVENICKSAFAMLGFLSRNTKDLQRRALQSFYNCFVRSVLEYCAVVWNPSYHKYDDMIEAVQKNS